MKWRTFFLNKDKLSELQMPGFSLFHSEIVEGKSFYIENGNAVHVRWSTRSVPQKN